MKYRIYRIPLRPSSWFHETDDPIDAIQVAIKEHFDTGLTVWIMGPHDCADVWGYIQAGVLEWFHERTDI